MNTAMLLTPKSTVSYLYGETDLEEGLQQFMKAGFTAVPVINKDGIYIGVMSEREILYRILDKGSFQSLLNEGLTISDLACDSRFEAVTIDAGVDTLLARITEQNFVPVVDSRGMFSGIVTRRAVLKRFETKLNMEHRSN